MDNRYRYDIPTAVTFLLAGLGVGSLLTVLFSSRFEKLVARSSAVCDEPTPTR